MNHVRDEADNYRRLYENASGETGQVREELKRCETRLRDLQTEVYIFQKEKEIFYLFIKFS